MYYTHSNYIDFVSYCSEFPTGGQLYTYRLHKKDYLTEIVLMENRFNDFKVLVSETKDTILNSTIFN